MKYLFIAVMFWGCTSNLQMQGPRHLKGDYHEGKLIGYGSFKSESPVMRYRVGTTGPEMLIAKPFYCIVSPDTTGWGVSTSKPFLRTTGNSFAGYDSTGLCKHIYVAVEPTSVRVPEGSVILNAIGADPKGKEIVCLKCHHVTNQKIEYYKDTTSRLPLNFGRAVDAVFYK